MPTKENDTTIVKTGSGGSASWFLVGALVVIVGIGAYLFLGGDVPGDSKDIDIKVELPGSG